jgi:hypothetical protein
VALHRINWKKDRGLVDKFGFPEHYFVGNFGEVDFKKFCICKRGKQLVLKLAKAQKIQLPDVEDKKQKASGGQETQDEKRICQVCKAKGGTGKKKAAALMATGFMDPSDHSKGRWCIRCRNATYFE